MMSDCEGKMASLAAPRPLEWPELPLPATVLMMLVFVIRKRLWSGNYFEVLIQCEWNGRPA